MRFQHIATGPALVVVALLSGCVGQAPPKVAVVPPPPQPAVVKPPEEPPISYVQNVAVLPPVQAIPAGALPPLDPPPQVADRRAETDATPRRHGQPNTAAIRKPAEPPATATVNTPVPVTPPAVVVAKPPVRLAEQNAPPRETVVAKINEVKGSAERLGLAKLTMSQNRTFKRVNSIIRLAEQAVQRGELIQANELADRAASLARALTGAN